MSPKSIMNLILSDGYQGECYSQELYGAFLRGFPLENLRRLLTSENDAAVQTAAYLVYELGWPVHPLVAEISELLQHAEPQVRFDAVHALRECTTKDDGEALGKAFLLLDDPSPFVHRGVIQFIQFAEDWKLRFAVHGAAKLRGGSVFETVISALIRKSPGILEKSELNKLVVHSDPIVRRFAAGMAIRPRHVVDEEFLDIALACNDEEGIRAVDWARDKALKAHNLQANLHLRERPSAPTKAQLELAYDLARSGRRTIEIAQLLRVDSRALIGPFLAARQSEHKKA